MDTGPRLLRANCQKWSDKVWMRKKELGIWREYTWQECYTRIKRTARGLICLGLEPGDNVSILGDNDPHWFWTELATQCAGGAVAGVFSDCQPAEIQHIVADSQSKFVVAQDQEQVDKLLQIRDQLPLVKKIIYWKDDGMRGYEDPILMYYDELERLGQEHESAYPALFDERIDAVTPDDLALLMYTSGTVGLPKGAMLTWRRLLDVVSRVMIVNPAYPTDDWVSFTLPGWITEQTNGLIPSLMTGQRLNFPEKQETVQQNIREIGPQAIGYPSRLWEMVASTIQQRMSETHRPKKLLYKMCLPLGYKVAELKFRGRRPNVFLRALYGLSKLLVFNPLRDRHGLSRVRVASTGGAVLGPDTFALLTAIGLDMRQGYGSTEMLLATMHFPGDIRSDSVGQPLVGSSICITDEGEILTDRRKGFIGYYGKPEATRKTFSGRWYHSGDAGYLDEDGHLFVLDRLESMRQLADGTRFPPQFIESRLKFSTYIRDVFVMGDESKDFIGAIVNIDFDNVGHWAEKNGVTYTTFANLSQKDKVCDLIAREIGEVNLRLPERFRVAKFVNLPKEFDPDEAELTRTRKVRRGLVEERYKDIAGAIYDGRVSLTLEVPVVYRDGRRGISSTEVKINAVEEREAGLGLA